MNWRALRGCWLGGGCLALTLLLQGCCSGPKCRDLHSGPDQDRVRAAPIKLGETKNDSVDVEAKDATDWKYVVLTRPGTLAVELHWDSDRAALALEVYDQLGRRLAVGAAWEQKGRLVALEAKAAGRYYIRVAAAGAEDQTHYSLRATYAPPKKRRCHNCTPGERVCLKRDGYAVCRKTPHGCNAWVEIDVCAKDQTCREGKCAAGCAHECEEGARRCAGERQYQFCRALADGCRKWSDVQSCGRRRRCDGAGQCVKARGGGGRPRPAPGPVAAKPANHVIGKVISIYPSHGRMTLHIEIGDQTGVKPGQVGAVLSGGSNTALPDGAIKVQRVSGRYCIATTSLRRLGNNRRVRINTGN